MNWLEVTPGKEPLLVSIPHTGTDIPSQPEAPARDRALPLAGASGCDKAAGDVPEILPRLVSRWLARKDTDWHVERLYSFAAGLGASVIRTRISRTVIDVNRDPSGASLYPGLATTELCPTTTFDGEPLYNPGEEPTPGEVVARRSAWFDPYHAALRAELARLRATHGRVVLYDCHSIRSIIPRLFDGELPHFNIGTNGGLSCDPPLDAAVEDVIASSRFTRVTNGRFRGGYITRQHGRPAEGVHAVQMELAMRGYLREPTGPVTEESWPPEYDDEAAAPMRAVLLRVLQACLDFAREGGPRP